MLTGPRVTKRKKENVVMKSDLFSLLRELEVPGGKIHAMMIATDAS